MHTVRVMRPFWKPQGQFVITSSFSYRWVHSGQISLLIYSFYRFYLFLYSSIPVSIYHSDWGLPGALGSAMYHELQQANTIVSGVGVCELQQANTIVSGVGVCELQQANTIVSGVGVCECTPWW